MAKQYNEKYICTLSPELLKKAKDELNEKEESRSRDIQVLRDMVLKEKTLRVRTDDAYLLRFLRVRKFDHKRAFDLIMTHFRTRAEHAELYSGLRPSAIRHVFENGVSGILPNRDKQGCKVHVLRPGRWDPDHYTISDIFREQYITYIRLIEEEETQVNGISMLVDLEGFTWHQGINVTPSFCKKTISLMQDAFPLRFKGMHFLNEPVIFDYIFTIFKPFMSSKMVARTHFHGNRYEELKEYIDEDNIPSDYGGKGPAFSYQEWMDELMQLDVQYDEQAKYGFTDTVLHKEKDKEDAITSMAGSFRKLDV